MSCNFPMLAVKNGFTSSGSVRYLPLGRYTPELAKENPGAIKIPCGKCRGCRATKTRAWADRMVLELDHSKKAVFLTLTYDDEHVPCRYNVTTGECVLSLNKRDLTLFFKRLRKHFTEKKEIDGEKVLVPKEIRYYACGEYGQGEHSTHRPHYHVILYGLELSDFQDLKSWTINELGDQYYLSEELAGIWKNGFVLLARVTWNTCAYVARYVKKKDFGFASDEYVQRLREPEFSVMSRDPGIGLYYPKEHPDCFEWSVFHFGDNGSSVKVYLPEAFLNTLKKDDPERYQELKEMRSKSMRDTEFNKLMQTDLDSFELDNVAEMKLKCTEPVIDFYRGL